MKKSKDTTPSVHKWRFFRAGGFDQVRLDTAQDLLSLEHLDQKLWVALAAPVNNVDFDSRTLSMIDTDNDGRVRAIELIDAVKWACKRLSDPEDLIRAKDSLSLDSINQACDEGKVLAASLRSALKALGKDENGSISVNDTVTLEKVLSERAFNGDGVITEDATDDESLKRAIREIASALGAVTDRSGKGGIDASKIELFFNQASEYNDWIKEADEASSTMRNDENTEDAMAAIDALREKVDDYFARCALARFDERSIPMLNGGDQEFSALSGSALSIKSDHLAKLPLSRVGTQSSLPLTQGINPAWTAAIGNLKIRALQPLLGDKECLLESEWRDLLAKFDHLYAWKARKPAVAVDTLDIKRIRELLEGPIKETLTALIEQDKAEAQTYSSLVDLEKLARLKRDLHHLCRNFVNFKDFYNKDGTAIFQAGALYLDQRSCHLCIKIEDATRHSLMAAMAGTYLVYCECRRAGGSQKMTVVGAVTSGDSENLIVGRNGVFYDRSGKDWDATVIKIIENPISIRQAFWLPYKSFVRLIETQVAKRAVAAESRSNAKLTDAATTAVNVDTAKMPPPQKLDIGIVAALGVAAGALGTFIATFFGYIAGIIKLGPLATIGAIAGVLVLISGPSIVLAYIKLRKRNLGPILDAAGWALNAKARISVPFGAVLTKVAVLPQGARCDRFDPYAEKKSPLPRIIVGSLLLFIAFTVLNNLGFINQWTGGRMGIAKVKPVPAIEINSPSNSAVVPTSTQN